MSVYAKLQQARVEVYKTLPKKTGRNQHYDYFELKDFLPKAQEVFLNLGLNAFVSYGTHESPTSTITITDCEDNSQIVISSPNREAQLKGCQDIQNLGAIQTYMRRYLWMTALEIIEFDKIEAEFQKPQEVSQDDIERQQKIKAAVAEMKALKTESEVNAFFNNTVKEILMKPEQLDAFQNIKRQVLARIKKGDK